MPYKDEEKRREYQRNYGRLRRAAGSTPGHQTSNPQDVATAGAMLQVITGLVNDILSSQEGDIFMRARTVGYLINIGLRACEIADLEGRISALEEKVEGGDKNGKHRE